MAYDGHVSSGHGGHHDGSAGRSDGGRGGAIQGAPKYGFGPENMGH